jgi:hypothetical protein
MDSRLRSFLVSIGVFLVGGAIFYVSQPSPADVSVATLRANGLETSAIATFAIVCPEKLTRNTANRLNNLGMCVGCRAGQIKRIARVAFLYADAGVVVPSLRASIPDAGAEVDGGEEGEPGQFVRTDDCYFLDAGVLHPTRLDGGWVYPRTNVLLESPFENGPNRMALVVPPCVLPNCFVGDGGSWVDTAVVDCKTAGAYALEDGGGRWIGCNVSPAKYASGNQCLPVECSVVAGDDPIDVLQ